MARNQKLSYKMNMFHFLTKQNYSKHLKSQCQCHFHHQKHQLCLDRQWHLRHQNQLYFQKDCLYFFHPEQTTAISVADVQHDRALLA